jgi:hypothetical protein
MKKPDYAGAVRDLMALLETIPELKESSSNSEIKDVTNENLGVAYQFSEHDLTIFKNKSDGEIINKTESKKGSKS